MKHNRILAAVAASAAVVGLVSACGHTSEPAAQPDLFPREQQCTDVSRPADPHNVLGASWFRDDACDILNLDHAGPGVDPDQAARIVYDARMKMVMGKRDLYSLAVEANQQLDRDHGVKTDFAGIIAQWHKNIKDELNASRDALAGHAPEGFRIEYRKGDVPSASPGIAPKK